MTNKNFKDGKKKKKHQKEKQKACGLATKIQISGQLKQKQKQNAAFQGILNDFQKQALFQDHIL